MIIALYSSKPQSGKSTVAEYLCDNYMFSEIKFAAPIYDMVRELARYAFVGWDDKVIESYITGENKSTPWPIVNVSTRTLMQTLGTDWARDTIYPAFWTDLVESTISWAKNQSNIVLSDLRFANEYDMLRRHDAVLIRVERIVVQYDNPHPSEGLLNDCRFDFYVNNNGTLDDLKCRIDEIMDETLA